MTNGQGNQIQPQVGSTEDKVPYSKPEIKKFPVIQQTSGSVYYYYVTG